MTERRIEQITHALRRGVESGVEEAAEYILGEADPHVPTDAGEELRKSGKVSSASTTSGAAAAVSYDTDYAALQHERMDYAHAPGETAKWLENAAQDRARIRGIVAATIIAELRRG